MGHVHVSTDQRLAEVRLERGKVNALDEEVVDELAECFRRLAGDPDVRSIVLTGTGKFFSFGFDIPGFLGHSKEAFLAYLRKFAALYRDLFAHPKPVVAALNGHAVAGGCMLALACDARLMAAGKGKVALNEGWDVNYGQGGVANGDNIGFSVPADNTKVTFSWNSISHVPTITVAAPAGTPGWPG